MVVSISYDFATTTADMSRAECGEIVSWLSAGRAIVAIVARRHMACCGLAPGLGSLGTPAMLHMGWDTVTSGGTTGRGNTHSISL